MEPGKKLFVITHAYHQYVCEIVEMLGPQRARCTKIRRIHSSRLDWEEFFKTGMARPQTTYYVFPDGELTWFNQFDWNHEILS